MGDRAIDGHEVVGEQSRHGAPEAVDRLVRVAYHDQSRSPFRWGDEPEQLELRRVDVLELVDKDETELRADSLPDRRVRLQELDSAGDQVAEVDHLRRLESLLVDAIDRCEDAQPFRAGGLDSELQ